MDFAFSDEQEAFREMVRGFLAETSPTAEVFRLIETPEGFDRGVWKQMAEELGLQSIRIPEASGGQGFGFLELGLVMEEMGHALLCAPYFSTVCLAANAILNAGSERDQRALLPGIAAGDTIATLAVVDSAESWSVSDVTLEFARDGDAYRLNGSKAYVTDGCSAELILVAARRPGTTGTDGITLLTVRGDAKGLVTRPIEPLDATRKIASLELSDAPAELLGEEGTAGPALARTLDQACVALASESIGSAQYCLDSAVEYAKQRFQFGRPIGSFQAIKHKCAEVLLELETARSAAYYASWAAENDAELPLAASVAKSCCDEANLRAAAENLHIHGGIGFTWEADPHLFYKRARATEALLGGRAQHRARIADLHGF